MITTGDESTHLALGSPLDDDGADSSNSHRGAVWILTVYENGTTSSKQKVSSTEGSFGGSISDGDHFGSAVASCDPFEVCLAVGASHAGSSRGAVWILSLDQDQGTVVDQQKISSSDGGFGGDLSDGDTFGGALTSLTLDTSEVLVVGAPGDDDGGADRGALWCLWLDSDGTVEVWQKISSTEGNFDGPLSDGDGLGSSLAEVGDLNSDGVGEIAAGASRADGTAGAVWILLLESGGTVKSSVMITEGTQGFGASLSTGDFFGRSAATVADLNGDGMSDLTVGAPGKDDNTGDAFVMFLLTTEPPPLDFQYLGQRMEPLPSKELDQFDFELVDPAPTEIPTAVFASYQRSCVVFETGIARCFGRNDAGQLGLDHWIAVGDDEYPFEAIPLAFPDPVRKVVGGQRHSCMLTHNGRVYCFGENMLGQLGYGSTDSFEEGDSPGSGGSVNLGSFGSMLATDLGVGTRHACAVLETGALRCWGSNVAGQLGLGHTETIGDNEVPSSEDALSFGASVASVACGHEFTCVHLASGDVHCFGWNQRGQLGLGHFSNVGDNERADSGDTMVALDDSVVSLCAGGYHACVVVASSDTSDPKVRCWGDNEYGQLGLGDAGKAGDQFADPQDPVSLDGVPTNVTCGFQHTCALMEDASVQCWGRNQFGQLGYGHTEPIGDDEAPAAAGVVDVDGEVDMISAGATHTCVITAPLGLVRCWGQGSWGQLGTGNQAHIGDDSASLPASVLPVRLVQHRCEIAGGDVVANCSLHHWPEIWLANQGVRDIDQLAFRSVPVRVCDIQLQTNDISTLPVDLFFNVPVCNGFVLNVSSNPGAVQTADGECPFPLQHSRVDPRAGAQFCMRAEPIPMWETSLDAWGDDERDGRLIDSGGGTAVQIVTGIPNGWVNRTLLSVNVTFGKEEQLHCDSPIWLETEEIHSIIENTNMTEPDEWQGGSRVSLAGLECMAPAGHGDDMLTAVILRDDYGDLLVFSNETGVSYAPPEVHFVDPSEGISRAGGVDMTLWGQFFGVLDAGSFSITVGERLCEESVRLNTTLAECRGVPPGSGIRNVCVSAGGQSGTPEDDCAQVTYTGPGVQQVSPSTGFPHRDTEDIVLEIDGSNLGESADAVDGIWINDERCGEVEWVNEEKLRCIGIPEGFGSVSMEIIVDGVAWKEDDVLQYAAPEIYCVRHSDTIPPEEEWDADSLADSNRQCNSTSLTPRLLGAGGESLKVLGKHLSTPGLDSADYTATIQFVYDDKHVLECEGVAGGESDVVVSCTSPMGAGDVLHVSGSVADVDADSREAEPVHYRAPVIVSVTKEELDPTDDSFIVAGWNFGPPAFDAVIRIGDAGQQHVCVETRVHLGVDSELPQSANTERLCESPAMIGADYSVSLEVGNQATLNSSVQVSFVPPVLDSVDPPFAFPSPTNSDDGRIENILPLNYTIRGRQCGTRQAEAEWIAENPQSHVARIEIAGAECGSVTLHIAADESQVSGEAVCIWHCRNVRRQDMTLGSASAALELQWAGRQSTIDNALQLSVVGTPTVRGVFPNSAGVQGGEEINVFGRRFGGFVDANVRSLSIGPYSCMNFSVISDSEVVCRLNPGIGADHVITIETEGGRRSVETAVQFSFEPPSVSSVLPSEVTVEDRAEEPVTPTMTDTTEATLDFQVRGSNFVPEPLWASSNRSIEVDIGRLPCPSVARSDTVEVADGTFRSTITCQQFPVALLAPGSHRVRVRVEGQESSDEVSVAVEGQPPDAPWAVAGVRRPGSHEDMIVRFYLAEQDIVTADEEGPREAPLLDEIRVAVVDSRSAAGGSVLTEASVSVEDGSMEIRRLSMNDSSTLDAYGLNRGAIPVSSLLAEYVWQLTFQVRVPEPRPLFVQVRVQNQYGWSDWSAISAPVVSVCGDDYFLATHRRMEEVECERCPSGAFCSGGWLADIVPRSGYWRIPWSPNTLEFVSCEQEEACVGWEDSLAENATVQEALARLHDRLGYNHAESADSLLSLNRASSRGRQLLPHTASRALAETGVGDFDSLFDQFALSNNVNWSARFGDAQTNAVRPSIEEAWTVNQACGEGYRGARCGACAEGFTPSPTGSCVPCLNQRATIAVGATIGAVCLVALMVLIWRVLKKSRELDVSFFIPLVKIVINHVNVVSLAVGIPLPWPTSVSGMGSAFDFVSAAGTATLSPSCAVSSLPGGSVAFSRVMLLFAMPVGFFVLAAIFWGFVGCCCSQTGNSESDEEVWHENVASTQSPQASDDSGSDSPPPSARTPVSRRPPIRTISVASMSRGAIPQPREAEAGLESQHGSSADARAENCRVSVQWPAHIEVFSGKTEAPLDHGLRSHTTAPTSTPASARSVHFGGSIRRAKSSRIRQWWARRVTHPLPVRYRFFVSIMVLLFLLQTPLTRVVFSLFACGPISDDNTSSDEWERTFLLGDPSTECWTSRHSRWSLMLGLPGVAFLLAVPLGGWLLMWCKREQLHSPASNIRRTFWFLISSYQDRYYYFECAIMLRKSVIAAVSQLLQAWGHEVQAIVATLVLFAAAIIQFRWEPFVHAALNDAEEMSLVISVVTLLGGVVVAHPAVSDTVSRVLGYCIVGSNVMFILMVILWMTRCGETRCGERLGLGSSKPPAGDSPSASEGPSDQAKRRVENIRRLRHFAFSPNSSNSDGAPPASRISPESSPSYEKNRFPSPVPENAQAT